MMPFYEYKAADPKKCCEHCRERFEEMEPMSAKPLKKCPCCKAPVERQISTFLGVIFKGKQANQFNDIQMAKYWRDNDGNRYPVTDADGRANSPTVSKKRKRTDAEVAAIKKRDAASAKKKRQRESYERYVRNVKKTKRQ